MSVAVVSLELADPLLNEARTAAAQMGLSLEEWICSVARERVSDLYISEKYFSRNEQPGDAEELLSILAKVPDTRPSPEDTID